VDNSILSLQISALSCGQCMYNPVDCDVDNCITLVNN